MHWTFSYEKLFYCKRLKLYIVYNIFLCYSYKKWLDNLFLYDTLYIMSMIILWLKNYITARYNLPSIDVIADIQCWDVEPLIKLLLSLYYCNKYYNIIKMTLNITAIWRWQLSWVLPRKSSPAPIFQLFFGSCVMFYMLNYLRLSKLIILRSTFSQSNCVITLCILIFRGPQELQVSLRYCCYWTYIQSK